MSTNNIAILYITVNSKENAENIASRLLDLGLAACVNIFDGVTSLYRWQGQVHQDKELIMWVKTGISVIGRVKDEVMKLHPYEVPCIVQLDAKSINDEFSTWMHCQIIE